MGFYATNFVEEKTYLPSKNRVRGFSGVAAARARRDRSNRQCSRLENESTPTTTVSGVRYYGFRFYGPEMGRWLSRDPIGSRGGANLYGAGHNSMIDSFDPIGLSAECCKNGSVVDRIPWWESRGYATEEDCVWVIAGEPPGPGGCDPSSPRAQCLAYLSSVLMAKSVCSKMVCPSS